MNAHATFTSAGWVPTKFNYRSAYRGPGGWVACRIPGQGWNMFRDTHAGTMHFATYRTSEQLLADAKRAMRVSRTRTEVREEGATTPRYGEWRQSDRWAPDDPRWG